jgi:hypothetical protein
VKACALAAGCTYSETDPAGIGEIRFVAFSSGKGALISNVVTRKLHAGQVVRAFDFATFVEYAAEDQPQSDSPFFDHLWGMDGWGDRGGTSRKERRYARARSGAMVKVDAFLPSLLAEPANLLTRAFERIGAEDIDFESEEFNRRFDVRCSDKRFASLFLDAQMIDFMLDFDPDFGFETFGNYVLCHGRRCEARRLPVISEKMGTLVTLLNPLVYDEYPSGAGIEYRHAVSEWNRRPGGANGLY